MTSFGMQAHAKVWHTYDTQWRAKQKGKQGSKSCKKKKKRLKVHPAFGFQMLRVALRVCRPGWRLTGGGLG